MPFYAKGMHSYGEHVIAAYHSYAGEQFASYVTRHFPLFAIPLALGAYVWLFQGIRTFTRVELGIAASTAVYLAYFRFFVLPIMGMECRFYFPTLPALVFLSTRCLVLSIERPGPVQRWFASARSFLGALVGRRPGFARLSAVSVLVAFTLVGVVRARQAVAAVREMRAQHSFDLSVQYSGLVTALWFRLDEVSALPNDLVMATTEVGLPSAFNPSKTIVDLAGLNDADVVRQGFLANRVVHRYRPDFLYMPHPDYVEMNGALMGDSDFTREYEVFPGERLGAKMGVALRRDSKYYPQLLAIVHEGARPL
nr:hypothetical protein Hi04_10k_c2441A_00025 [uncultured bacterium]